jgi:DNA-directed RNA polymerase subunit K/omega
MLYPSIQELLKATEKDGKERLNKYSITMVTAKCARVITNEYAEQSYYASKKTCKDQENTVSVKKEYKDEKSVKNALREMKEGEFEVYLPGEEGYEDSMVEIKNYVEPKEEPVFVKPAPRLENQDEDEEDFDDELDGEEEEFDTEELMGASTVFDDDAGYSVEDAE